QPQRRWRHRSKRHQRIRCNRRHVLSLWLSARFYLHERRIQRCESAKLSVLDPRRDQWLRLCDRDSLRFRRCSSRVHRALPIICELRKPQSQHRALRACSFCSERQSEWHTAHWHDATNPCVRSSTMPAISPPGAMALICVSTEPGTEISFDVPFLYMYACACPCPTITPELLIR